MKAIFNFQRRLNVCLFVAVSYSLGGCVSTEDLARQKEAMVAAAQERAQLETVKANEGAIALTVRFGRHGDKVISPVNPPSYRLLLRTGLLTGFTLGPFVLNETNTVFYKMEPGTYKFYGANFYRGELHFPKSLEFTVKAGEISYLGDLQFELDDGYKYNLEITNQSDLFLDRNKQVLLGAPLRFVPQVLPNF